MKKIILLLLLVIVSVSCKNIYENEFIINSPSVVVSKQSNGNTYKLKYKYIVKHYYVPPNFHRTLDLYTNQDFKVGDTIKLTTK